MEKQRKTTPNVQNVQSDIMHGSETHDDQFKVTDWHQLLGLWFSSWWTRAEFIQAQKDLISSCEDFILWYWAAVYGCKDSQKQIKSFSKRVRNQISCMHEIHAYYVDMVSFLNPVTNACSQDHGMVKWVNIQPWSVGRQEGRRISTCQYTYSSLQGNAG